MTCPNRQGHTLTEIAEMTSASPDEEGTGEQSKQLTTDRRNRKGSGLDSMVLAELKQLASSLGIKGTGAMRKSQLIDAIRSAQRGPGARGSRGSGRARQWPPQPPGRPATAEMSPARWMSCNERRARPATSARRHRCSSTPYSLSWSRTTQPSNSTPDQRQDPVADRRRRSGPRGERRATGRVATPSRSPTGHLMRRRLLRPAR